MIEVMVLQKTGDVTCYTCVHTLPMISPSLSVLRHGLQLASNLGAIYKHFAYACFEFILHLAD